MPIDIFQDLDKKQARKPIDIFKDLDKKQQKGSGSDITDYLKETASNIPQSGVNLLKSIVTPLIHPVETGKALGKTALGFVEKLVPGDQGHEQYANSVIDFFNDRYGGIEKVKKTIKKDPVGFLADASTVLSGGGAALRGIGAAGKLSTVARAGKLAGEAGAIVNPMNATKPISWAAAKLVPRSATERLYQSGAKFSTKLSREERTAITRTALDNEINMNLKGFDRTKTIIDGLQQKISDKIDQVATPGNLGFYKMDVNDLFKDFGKLYHDASLTGTPIENIKALDKIRKGIKTVNDKLRGGQLTPDEVQTLKTNIHEQIYSYYSQMKDSPISVKGQKAVARAAKEELESIIPEIKGLNAKEGAMIELRDALQKASSRIMNRDLIGIGVPIKGTMGGVIGGTAGTAAGIAIGLLDKGSIKGKIAIVINRLKQKGITVSPTEQAVKLGLFQIGRDLVDNGTER